MPIQVIAHRGASHDRPENSIAAFEEALRQGCDAIELDVQLTRNNVPVAYHDKNLVRLARPDRQVADLAHSELALLAHRSSRNGGAPPYGIPTLDEVLERFGDRTRLLIEIKTREKGEEGIARHRALMRRTLKAVKSYGLSSTVSILSYDLGLLRLCAEEAPELPRILNIRPGRSLEPELARVLPELAALSADVRTLTPEFAAAVRGEGCPLLVFVCNETPQVNLALISSAAGIMSDRPGWLRARLEPDACLA